MAVKVMVGHPVISINHGSTFLVSELDGSVTDASDQGLYARDTRYLSCYVHDDFYSALMLTLDGFDSKALYGNGCINFVVDLTPSAVWHVCCRNDQGARL